MTDQDQTPNQNADKGPSDSQSRSGLSPILIVGIIVLAIAAVALVVVGLSGRGGSPAEPQPPAGSSPPPPTVSVPTPEPGIPVATAQVAINVRSGPGTNYPTYGVAPEGAQAEVIGRSPDGGWWVVKLPAEIVSSGQGWVSAEFVQTENTENVPVITPPEPPPVVNPPTPNPDAPRATALEAIHVRSGPGTDYPSYGIAPKGAQGEVIGVSEDGKWWVVKVLETNLVPTGQGWVSADWVLVENADGVPVIPAP